MPSRARLFALCAVSLTLVLSGCASDRLAATAPSGVRLNGDWALDPAASEDIGRTVAQLRAQIRKAHHAQRRRAAQDGFGVPVRGGRGEPSGDSDEAAEGRGQGRQESSPGTPDDAVPPGSALIQEFRSNVPGNELTITVAPGSVTVLTGNSSQQYTPGVQTAIEWGQISAEQISGWHRRRFVIDTRPEWGPVVTQSYSLAPDGKLVVTLKFRGAGVDATLTRRYRRTSRAPAALVPTGD